MYAPTSDRPTSTQLILLLAITAAIAFLLVSPASAQRQPRSHRQAARPNPPATAVGNLVTHDLATGGETPESLVQALVGPGAIVSNVHYTGAPIAAGTFSGGTGIIGFESGVILSSGDIVKVVSPVNTSSNEEPTQNNTPGDPDLDAILGATYCCSFDAAVLEFDLECPTATAASFQYVFASEEYDYVPEVIDDLFACFVNGQNVALLPGTSAPVTLHTVNCGAGSGWPSGPSCGFHLTNDCDTLGVGFPCSHLPTEMDGLTVVLSATAALHPGPNHVKLAIADSFDDVVDSDVFLRGLSFVCSPGLPVFEATSHCTEVLKGWAGAPFDLDVNAWATSALPEASITLDVTGDPIPLAAGSFVPPLPTSPAQPGTTHFQWTPTPADVGLHHLVFTATDEFQQSASMDVTLQISASGAPVFELPSPCNQTLDLAVDNPFTFSVRASAWTALACGRPSGIPGEGVTLTVTGDAPPLAGGTFVPPLPAGPVQPVSSQFRWTPTLADVGTWHLEFNAVDGLQHSASCSVTLRVRPSPGIDLCQPGVEGVLTCPCGNPPAVSPGGCDNSSGTGGARLDSTGLASADFSTVVFTTSGERPSALSVLFQGRALLSQGALYGQGVRCVGQRIKRLYVKAAIGGSITAPESGDLPVPSRSEQLGEYIVPGTTRYYAVYYRDPVVLGGCPAGSTFNITQTQRILWHE